MIEYLGIFLLNMMIELIVASLLRFRSTKKLSAIVAVNGITHPILTVLVLYLLDRGFYYFSLVLVLEVLVVLTEWQLFQFIFRDKNKKYLFLSGVMNAASYGIGLLLFNQ